MVTNTTKASNKPMTQGLSRSLNPISSAVLGEADIAGIQILGLVLFTLQGDLE
jgi:hypothetical protein